jgi:hypothetical protein
MSNHKITIAGTQVQIPEDAIEIGFSRRSDGSFQLDYKQKETSASLGLLQAEYVVTNSTTVYFSKSGEVEATAVTTSDSELVKPNVARAIDAAPSRIVPASAGVPRLRRPM